MRRTDRLFDLIQILRDGRLHRATDLALRVNVSDRTIWRDMATLMASGLPVEGERGVGYILRAPITLPPMILTQAEREALRSGLRLVAEGRDEVLARAARTLADKISAASPAPVTDNDDLFATPTRSSERAARHLPLIRRATRAQEKLALTYLELDGTETHADIRPLRLEQSGQVMTLQVQIEGRGLRNLRLDRVMALDSTGEYFTE